MYIPQCVLLNFMHLQQFVNMVPDERSSMVGLPHYIQITQTLFEWLVERAILGAKFPLDLIVKGREFRGLRQNMGKVEFSVILTYYLTILSASWRATDASCLNALRVGLDSGSGRLSAMKVVNCSNMVAWDSWVVSRVFSCDRWVRRDEYWMKLAPPALPPPSASFRSSLLQASTRSDHRRL